MHNWKEISFSMFYTLDFFPLYDLKNVSMRFWTSQLKADIENKLIFRADEMKQLYLGGTAGKIECISQSLV